MGQTLRIALALAHPLLWPAPVGHRLRQRLPAQIATDAKSNEITAVPKVLDMLSLKGTIVTVDVFNCHRENRPQDRREGR